MEGNILEQREFDSECRQKEIKKTLLDRSDTDTVKNKTTHFFPFSFSKQLFSKAGSHITIFLLLLATPVFEQILRQTLVIMKDFYFHEQFYLPHYHPAPSIFAPKKKRWCIKEYVQKSNGVLLACPSNGLCRDTTNARGHKQQEKQWLRRWLEEGESYFSLQACSANSIS